MNSLKPILLRVVLVLACVLALLGFGLWRHIIVGGKQPSFFLIAKDISGSDQNKCQCLKGVVTRMQSLPGITNASTISILRTGDEPSANEPVLMAEFLIPLTRKVVEGRQGLEEGREQLLTRVFETCRSLPQSDRSPIFQTLRRGVEHLHARGCGSATPCWFYMITDGEELTEPRLREALHGTGAVDKMVLPTLINNEGIHIIFLGMAQTTGININPTGKAQSLTRDRSKDDPIRVQKIWQKVFSQPQLVTFEPFCSAPTPSGQQN